ncbi:MAG: hypothetical protein ACKPH7_35465, partial [Planktothrix sp.]|uniref:hypothetical protein n=1 Tax=Planktothrix sp. TaxID=3088171 RepID=UPI0038D4773D
QTREIIKDTFRDEVGAKLAINIANGVRLEHINETKGYNSTSKGKSPFAILLLFLCLLILRGSR